MDYARYAPLVADAKDYPSLWRLLFGSLTALVVAIAWIAVIVGIAVFTLPGTPADFFLFSDDETPAETVLLLLTIVGFGIGTWVAARFWQKRGLRSLMGRGPRVLRHFVIAAFATFAVAAVLFVVSLPIADPVEPNLSLGLWLLWLPVALAVVALQTGAEELLFRGYLQSQLAARFAHPIIWLVFPSLLFGVAHFAPDLPRNAALVYIIWATVFGLIAGDLTARTGSIGAAWGMHFANNTLAILVVVAAGPLSGLGLYQSGDILNALTRFPLVILDLIGLGVVWMVIRRILAN